MQLSSRKRLHLILIFSAFFTYGCSTTGMITAPHNGKKYWNPGNCDRYRYDPGSSDRIYCQTKNSFNGTVLDPASDQQIENYYREQETMMQYSRRGHSSRNINCYNMFDISYNKEIKTFSGNTCPYGWLESY